MSGVCRMRTRLLANCGEDATRQAGTVVDGATRWNPSLDLSCPDSDLSTPPSDPPKGRSRRTSTGSRLPSDWTPSEADLSYAEQRSMSAGLMDYPIDDVAAIFRDYWHGIPGAKGRKADWPATWRNWVRRDIDDRCTKNRRQDDGTETLEYLEQGAREAAAFARQDRDLRNQEGPGAERKPDFGGDRKALGRD